MIEVVTDRFVNDIIYLNFVLWWLYIECYYYCWDYTPY